MMQRYTIIKLLEDLTDGDEFLPQDYPLHITIAPSFRLDSLTQGLFEQLQAIAANHTTIPLLVGQDESFGPHQESRVTTIIMNEALHALHTEIIAVLSRAGAIFDESEYIAQNYRAHATVQPHLRLRRGERVTIDAFTVIDKLPHGDSSKRKLLRTFTLAS